METGTALSRAMTYIMQRNKDTSKQKVQEIVYHNKIPKNIED